MAKNDNLTDFLADVADAIRAKKGTTSKINPQDFSSEIASIETGGGGGDTPTPDTPTPDIPVIGDGKTYLYIKIAVPGRMTVPLYFTQTVANGVTIDWGDGSETQTVSGTGNVNTTHTYADIGDYTISLNPDSGCTLGLGNGVSAYCVMGGISDKGRIYCNMLQAVEIGKNVISIGDFAFNKCSSLSSIVIPDGVTSIGNRAFSVCYSLSSIEIPSSVTSIGKSAFDACHSLTSIVIPSRVTSIGDAAFYDCASLTSVVIQDGVTSISNSMFLICFSLVSVVIPSSVTSIGDSAFYGCDGMVYYDFRASKSVPTLGGMSTFNNIPSDCKIVVPNSLYDTWIAATNWSTYTDNIIKASEFNG